MPASLATVLAAGAPTLDLAGPATIAEPARSPATPHSAVKRLSGYPVLPLSPMHSPIRSPMRAGASPSYARTSFVQASLSPSSPVVVRTGTPVAVHQASPFLARFSMSGHGLASPTAALASPTSGASFSTAALSPGGAIRRNATAFGIPLDLRGNSAEVPYPVPLRSAAGTVLMPSPAARRSPGVVWPSGQIPMMPGSASSIMPTHLNFGNGPASPTFYVAMQPIPAPGATVMPRAQLAPAQIRAIVTPLRAASMRGGA